VADDPSARISDSTSTAAAAPAAHSDAELVALVEKRLAARALTREVDDDDANAAYYEIDRIDARAIQALPGPHQHPERDRELLNMPSTQRTR
jgi:hypothetical protein